VGKLLRKLSFRRLSVRPQHPQSKPEEQAVFKAVNAGRKLPKSWSDPHGVDRSGA
jgi:hypothetical protein